MNRNTLINIINDVWPVCKAVPSEDFHPSMEGGIWLRGSDDIINNMPVFDEFVFPDTEGMFPEIYSFVVSSGWFFEPYDGCTQFIWNNN